MYAEFSALTVSWSVVLAALTGLTHVNVLSLVSNVAATSVLAPPELRNLQYQPAVCALLPRPESAIVIGTVFPAGTARGFIEVMVKVVKMALLPVEYCCPLSDSSMVESITEDVTGETAVTVLPTSVPVRSVAPKRTVNGSRDVWSRPVPLMVMVVPPAVGPSSGAMLRAVGTSNSVTLMGFDRLLPEFMTLKSMMQPLAAVRLSIDCGTAQRSSLSSWSAGL